MKIVALLPFKNEISFLPAFMKEIKHFTPTILGYNNSSTDGSDKLFTQLGGTIIGSISSSKPGWPEHLAREKLLHKAREIKVTHIICLDADEAFTSPFIKTYRDMFITMKPGDRLSLQWLALWKSQNQYRDDHSIWSNNYKDFVFCDDRKSKYQYEFLGVGRTPLLTGNSRRVSKNEGAVLHYQFVDWDAFQIKQAWYRCAELINHTMPIDYINKKYEITLDTNDVKNKSIPPLWIKDLMMPPEKINQANLWRYSEILEWFNRFGLLYFEELDIWHINELKSEFVARMGRLPKPLTINYQIIKKLKQIKKGLHKVYFDATH